MEAKYELFEKIRPIIKEKRVLDIGCVGEFHNKEEPSDLWVHGFLSENAKEAIGIDILEKDIKKLRKMGYKVYNKNAESFSFDKKFDVIFAGELIEHLGNPLTFLEKCCKHLKNGGKLILTTPNTFNLYENFFNVLLLRHDPPINPQHTCYYSPSTIKELFNRTELNIIKIEYFDFYGSLFGKIRFKISDFLGEKFKRRILIIAKK